MEFNRFLMIRKDIKVGFKNRIVILTILFSQITLALLPDAPGRDYLQQLQLLGISGSGELEKVLKLGKRNIEWLDFMNQFRDEKNKIHFTKPGSLVGYPLEKPNKYSEKIVLQRYSEWLSEVPSSIKGILVEGQPFVKAPPNNIEEYIAFGLKADRIYQSAARWIMMKPNLQFLAQKRFSDMRGFYFLSQIQNLQSEFSNWQNLTEDQKKDYRTWLIQLCFNVQQTDNGCETRIDQAITQGRQYDYYTRAVVTAKALWNRFFLIPIRRNDIKWNSQNPDVAVLNFQNPKNDRILNFLKFNIEDEFKFLSWGLKLLFVDQGSQSTPRVEFQPGVVPHVNGIAGNIITMDANSSIDEWDVQWTIRHEFGHVLGFPDCYIEFYLPDEEVIMNYQLDVTNLMCSRAGKLKELHIQELKNKYYRAGL